jgi:hypothetical protein
MAGMETNIIDLATCFYNSTIADKQEMEQKFYKTHQDIENSIIHKDLNSHKINTAIAPPTNFSSAPTIKSAEKLAEIIKIFPRNHKFSGSKQDNNVSVVEFLNTLKAAQEQTLLSESEFIDRMLAASTGHAHELILEWSSNGENVASIYHNLLLRFDKRLTADEAKEQLITYRIPKTSNLASAEGHIMILASRAASSMPTESQSRINYYNHEACNTLIRALPPTSSSQVNNLYNQISARLGRAATFAELSRALNIMRTSIDKDIKQHGAENQYRNKKLLQMKPMAMVPKRKYVAYSLTIDKPKQYMVPRNGNNTQYTYKNTYNTNTSYTPRPINMVRPYQNGQPYNNTTNPIRKIIPKRGPDGKFLKRGNNNNNNTNNPSTDRKCTLCGLSNHKSTNCRNIINDNGKKIDIIPTYGVCSKCPAKVQPRLHHPESLCPYRIGGPLNKE